MSKMRIYVSSDDMEVNEIQLDERDKDYKSDDSIDLIKESPTSSK